MNTLRINLIVIFSFLLFVGISCCKKEDPEPIDTDIEARKCEDGSTCPIGSLCNDNSCGCPDGTFYYGRMHMDFEMEKDSICVQIKEYMYELIKTEGDPNSHLENLEILDKITPGYSDTTRFVFYNLQGDPFRGIPERSEPFIIDMNATLARNGDSTILAFKKDRELSPMRYLPKIFAWEWYMEFDENADKVLIKVDYTDSQENIKWMDLYYERVGVM